MFYISNKKIELQPEESTNDHKKQKKSSIIVT